MAFFDLGSILIDETACTEYRIMKTLLQPGAPPEEEFRQRMKQNISGGRLPYKDTVKDFQLKKVEWPKHLEYLYSGVPEILQELHERYKSGIIANQSPGNQMRLKKWGIYQYFQIILASAEEGISKPDHAIYERALNKADACLRKPLLFNIIK